MCFWFFHFHKTNEIILIGQESKVIRLKPNFRARLAYQRAMILADIGLTKTDYHNTCELAEQHITDGNMKNNFIL